MAAFDPVKCDSHDASAWDAADGAVQKNFLDEGDANAAVSTTDTTLTDTRESWTASQWVGWIVECGGKTMTVTANTATVLTGASWSGGGNPGNGLAWKLDNKVTDDNTAIDFAKQGKSPDDIVKVYFDLDPLGLAVGNTISVWVSGLHNYGTMALLPYSSASGVTTTDKITVAAVANSELVFTLTQNWIDDLFDQGDLGTVSGRTNSFAVRIVEDLEISGDAKLTEIDSVLSEGVTNELAAVLATVLTVAAGLNAQGKLDAVVATIVSTAADLKAAGELQAAAALLLTVTANVTGLGSLSAAIASVLTVAANLDAAGQMNAALLLAVTPTAGISALGRLEAAVAIVSTVAANLTDAIDLNAVLPISVSTIFGLAATGGLTAAILLTSTITADLTAQGLLAATPSLAVSVAADVQDGVAAQLDVYPLSIEWIEKPPEGTPINLHHSMTEDLFFFCAMDRGGNQVDLIQGREGTFIDTGTNSITTHKQTPEGIVAEIQGAVSGKEAGWDFGDTNATSQVYEPTELTIITQVRVDEVLDTGGQRTVSKRTSAGGNDDWTIYIGGSDNIFTFRVNGLDDAVTKSSGNWLGHLVDLALAVDSAGQDNYVWSLTDGTRDFGLGEAGATVDQSDGNLCIGHRQAEERVWDGDIHYVALFNKKKTQTFIEDFRKNPWQIFKPRHETLLIESGVAVGDDIVAVLPIILTALADLRAQGKLDAVLALTTSVAADLRAIGAIQAANTITLSVLADLQALGSLSSVASIAITVAAALNAEGRLDAATQIVVTVAAGLTAQGKLDAASSIILSVAADVTGPGVDDLIAVIPIVLSTVPGLTALGSLASAPSLVLSAVADLRAEGKLDSAINLLVTLAADLRAAGVLQATLNINTTVAANITAEGELQAGILSGLTVAANIVDPGAAAPDTGFRNVWTSL